MSAMCTWLLLTRRLFCPLHQLHVSLEGRSELTAHMQAAAVRQHHRELPACACCGWDGLQCWSSVWHLQKWLLLWKRT